MLSVQKWLLVNKFKLFFVFLFFLLQVYIFNNFILRQYKTVSIQCSSSFIRNIKGDPNMFFTGEIMLKLRRDGKAQLFIDGHTDETIPKLFKRAYFFDYYLDRDNVIIAKKTSEVSGVANELPKTLFEKKFIGLEFRLSGGLKINKFNNVYVLSTPGFIVNTCAPT